MSLAGVQGSLRRTIFNQDDDIILFLYSADGDDGNGFPRDIGGTVFDHRFYTGNRIDHIHPLDDFPEHRITITSRSIISVVQARIVHVVDVEMAGDAVYGIHPPHGDRSSFVAQPVGRFILYRRLARFLH